MELDFLGLRAAAPGEQHGKSTGSSSLSSIRGMETSAIARIDPQLLRRVVVARSPATEEAPAAPSPMTVFYNGSVAIFDVSHHKAEAIMQMARDVTMAERRDLGNNTPVGNSSKDIPLARTKSLQQFLVKRKERLTRMGPYHPGAVGAPSTTVSNNSLRVKKETEAT